MKSEYVEIQAERIIERWLFYDFWINKYFLFIRLISRKRSDYILSHIAIRCSIYMFCAGGNYHFYCLRKISGFCLRRIRNNFQVLYDDIVLISGGNRTEMFFRRIECFRGFCNFSRYVYMQKFSTVRSDHG